MLHFLIGVAVCILTLCFWLIFRPEAAEQAAWSAYLDRKQRKVEMRELRRKQPPSGASYWIISLLVFLAPLAIWFLFH